MIGQNFLIDLMSKLPDTSQEVKKPEFTKSNYSQFNSVLSSALNKAPTDDTFIKREIKTVNEKDNDIKRPDQKPLYKAFREIKPKDERETKISKVDSGKETKETTSEATSDVHKADDKKDVKETTNNDKAAVEAMAQIMGIPAQDLMQVLSSLNIKPQDLTDASKASEVVDKLSSAMNLSTQEKQTLSEIFKTLKAVIGESTKQALDDSPKQTLVDIPDNKAQVKTTAVLENINKNVEGTKLNNAPVTVVKLEDLSDVLAKFKTNIEQLTKKLQQNPEKLISEFTSQIKEAVAEKEVKYSKDDVKTPGRTEDTSSEEVKLINSEGQEKTDSKSQSETKKQGEEKGNWPNESKTTATEVIKNTGETNVTNVINVTSVNSVNKDNGSTLQLNNQVINQIQKVDDSSTVAKIQKEVPVTKNEIINQVIEKAKVTLTADKSEMSMDLKPDNLGKLALKVITERGIVVAKFVAESQQVKETLEANMQTLKDSLEKQGLSVQGFSVTVQQNPHKDNNRQNETDENKKQGLNRNEQVSDGTVNVVSILENQKRVNAYNWSDSSINLTA